MKKTVQIVTIPLDKTDAHCLWKSVHDIYEIGIGKFPLKQQQLLVLSDYEIEIQEGDIVYGGEGDTFIHKCQMLTTCRLVHCKKIIASYPQIEGTLPISKETVQAWIDSGTPGEGSVEMEQITLKSTGDTYPTRIGYRCMTNPKGDLLLEFGEEIYPVEEAILQALKENHLPIDDDFAEGNVTGAIFGAEWERQQNKPPIPTDEEIEQKANYFRVNNILWETKEHGICLEAGYSEGYKQALKDLGHANV